MLTQDEKADELLSGLTKISTKKIEQFRESYKENFDIELSQ